MVVTPHPHCSILTLFPEVLDAYLHHSIFARAQKKYTIHCTNIRDFAHNKHNRVDDTLAGGTAGMLIQAPVIERAIQHVRTEKSFVIHASPRGKLWTQQEAETMAQKIQSGEHLIFVCGHYEGIDQRCIDSLVDAEYSLGPYILTGGETATLAMVESIIRLLPEVLWSAQSHQQESHTGRLQDKIEHPQYTKPEVWNGYKIPSVLLSGHHKYQEDWREFGSFASPYISQDRYPELQKIPGTCDPRVIQSYSGSALALETVRRALYHHPAFQKRKKPDITCVTISWEAPTQHSYHEIIATCCETHVIVWHPQETEIHEAVSQYLSEHTTLRLPWKQTTHSETQTNTSTLPDWCLCWDGATVSLINVWQKLMHSA